MFAKGFINNFYNDILDIFVLFKYIINTLLFIRNYINVLVAPVAQLDRALGYGPGGSGFKS